MSLFGTSPPSTSSTSNRKSDLFNEPSTPRKGTGSGLFADDSNAADDSPWGFTPKKQARSNLVRTLLPAGDVPESYIDRFESLAEGSSVPFVEVGKLLDGAKVSAQVRQQIVDIVAPQGLDAAGGLGRGEFNVLLALIGLAQEGEEVSLDSVDDRRRRKTMSLDSYKATCKLI